VVGALDFPTIIPSSALGKDGAVAPSERINIGVIGCGRRSRVAGLYLAVGLAEIVALAGANQKAPRSWSDQVLKGRKPREYSRRPGRENAHDHRQSGSNPAHPACDARALECPESNICRMAPHRPRFRNDQTPIMLHPFDLPMSAALVLTLAFSTACISKAIS
jgi:hypothetical protein